MTLLPVSCVCRGRQRLAVDMRRRRLPERTCHGSQACIINFVMANNFYSLQTDSFQFVASCLEFEQTLKICSHRMRCGALSCGAASHRNATQRINVNEPYTVHCLTSVNVQLQC